MRNIVLIGFMGSGKSTVGKILSRKLNLPFVDTDLLVEERAGKAIKDIFRSEGESHFRFLEKQVVKDVAKKSGWLIACGGGVVLDEQNVEALKKRGILVYLRVVPSVACQRTQDSDERPLLNFPDFQEKVKEILCAREAIYEEVADFSVDTSKVSVEQVSDIIIRNLKKARVIIE